MDAADDPEVNSSNVVFPRKLLRQFILLYKEFPCLWDRKCVAYKNKAKRHEAISQLTSLVQEHDSTATRVHVFRKIESLRACIRREHKRVVESRKKRDPDEVYTPSLWYYNLFSFVFGDEGSTSVATKTNSPEHVVESTEDEEVILGDDEPSFEQHTYAADYSHMVEVIENPGISKRYTTFDDDHNKNSKRLCAAGIDDEYDAIGINVAAKLRTLPANMRILAEKLINDVLFQAQVNGLSSSTVISTPDPFKEDK